jgi:hypothetical protein
MVKTYQTIKQLYELFDKYPEINLFGFHISEMGNFFGFTYHKDTKQIIININAKVIIKTFANSKKKKFILRNSGDYIICNKKTWVEIKFLKSGYLSVVCDKIYDKKDYIYDINKLSK